MANGKIKKVEFLYQNQPSRRKIKVKMTSGNIIYIEPCNEAWQQYGDDKMARIALATNYGYKGTDGCPVLETTWHNVIAWEGRNIKDVDMIEKGTKLHVIGRIRYQNYTDADGVDRVATEIIASKVEIVREK